MRKQSAYQTVKPFEFTDKGYKVDDREVVIPYTPRPIWAKEIHPALDKYRFAVLVCHRRFGKTVGTVNQMIKAACLCDKPAPRYAYVAPYRNQAKMIAWQYLKHYTSVIPGQKVNESELYVQFPSIHDQWEGARIYIIGADHPDALRGGYWDGVILDEYAQIKKELWGQVIRASLADREGWAIFIGTPKGQNQFYDVYMKAKKDPRFFTCMYRADESGVLSQNEIDDMANDMTDMELRQELYCDFQASNSDVVIPIDLVVKGVQRELREFDVKGQPVTMGVDIARFGDDRSCIAVRQGLWLRELKTFKNTDTMEMADRIIVAIRDWSPQAVFVDVGSMGAGVIDRLRQLRYHVNEVNFGGRAMSDKRYANLRAEMYFKCRAWFKAGGAIPDDQELRQELSTVEYKFSPNGRIILESKEDIKKKTGKSPDKADAFVLTFARPVWTPDGRVDYKDGTYRDVYQQMNEEQDEEYNALKDYISGVS